MSFILDNRQIMLLAKRLAASSGQIAKNVAREATAIGYDYVRHVRSNKLSGQVLKRRSGWLTNHVTMQVSAENGNLRLRGGVFGGVPYAGIHEYGFKGVVEVGGYIRKDGASVRAHQRHVDMPVRSYLRSALGEKHGEYAQRLLKAAQPLRKQS